MVHPAESAPEEPGDESPDGPDEEPAVGRQRNADAQEVTSLDTWMDCGQIQKTGNKALTWWRWRGFTT